MSYLTAVLLGLVQGITEFLPVSSSGHLALLQNIFLAQEPDLMFDACLHLGTLLSLLLAFHRDIRAVTRGGLGLLGLGQERGKTNRRNANRRRMAVFLTVGTVPLALALPLRSQVAAMYHNTPLISLMLVGMGTILYVSDRYSGGNDGIRETSAWKAFLVGLAQVPGVIPGLSRAGITISAGTLLGMKRSFAVWFSFLLSVPAVLGAVVVTFYDGLQAGSQSLQLPQYLCGMLAAAVSGYFSIGLLRYLAAKHKFGGFIYYCWGAGLISMALSLIA